MDALVPSNESPPKVRVFPFKLVVVVASRVMLFVISSQSILFDAGRKVVKFVPPRVILEKDAPLENSTGPENDAPFEKVQ